MPEPSAPTVQNPPGFQALEPLSSAGPVAVFTATRMSDGQKVKLWWVQMACFPDAGAEQRFVQAVRAAMRIDHPQVSRPISVEPSSDGGHWLCGPLSTQPTLTEQLAVRGKLEVDDAVLLAQGLCDALAATHAAGTVHHGLRPEAVVLAGGAGDPTVTLGEYGTGFLPAAGSTHGAKGVPLVSPAYAAPECIEGAEPSAGSDLYALGVLLYTAVTGAPPFNFPNSEDTLHAHLALDVPALPAGASALAPVIKACLEKEPARRPASAKEVAALLKKANQTLVPPVSRQPGRISYPELPFLPPAKPGEEAPGDVLGVFELVKLLGEGAMGRVFLARHTLLGRQVALKVLRPEQIKKEELIQRFVQEARTVNQINHEHIVEIIDFVVEPKDPSEGPPRAVYCVMEVLEGKTLSAEMAEGPINVQRTANIMAQVCGALWAAHKVGVVHRDVKPDNIFLTERMGEKDYVKVLDFGVAKLTAGPGDAPLVSTLDGALIGTPVCMSPEQAAGKPVDHRTDIYASGIMLYEMLSGTLPFNAANFGALAVQIITQPPPPLPAKAKSGEPIPEGLRQLVMRCLAKDAAQRPQTMEAVRDALTALARGDSMLVPEDDAKALRRGPGPAAMLGLLALVVVGAGAAYFAFGKGPAPVEVPIPTPAVAPPVVPVPVEPVAVKPPEPVVPVVEKPPEVPTPPDPPPVAPQKVLPKLTGADLAAVVSRGQKDVQACIKRHRLALKESEGQVEVQIKVEPTGRVSLAEVTTPNLQGTPFAACVVGEVKRFVFPRFKTKAVKFKVPFSWKLSD